MKKIASEICKLIIEEKEVTEQNEFNTFKFYQHLSSKQTDFKQNDLIDYLDKINLPILPNGQKQISDTIIPEKGIYDALT